MEGTNLFQLALGLAVPWHVTDCKLDLEQGCLNIDVDWFMSSGVSEFMSSFFAISSLVGIGKGGGKGRERSDSVVVGEKTWPIWTIADPGDTGVRISLAIMASPVDYSMVTCKFRGRTRSMQESA
jgi:hypothetical protein